MTNFHFFPADSSVVTDWKGYKLVIPTVAVGNVGQLAQDLLIASLLRDKKLTRSGRISCPFVRPVVGPNAYDIFSSIVTTSIEVYHSTEYQLVLIQVRSPPFSESRGDLLNLLSSWIVENGFSRVFVLTSSFSHFLPRPDPSGSCIKFLASSSILDSDLRSRGLQLVGKVDPHSYKPDEENGRICIPGSGIGKKLLHSVVAKDANLEAVLLVSYCSEGDNTPDAINLAEWLMTNVVGGSHDYKLVTPVSWSKFFGEEIPNGLY